MPAHMDMGNTGIKQGNPRTAFPKAVWHRDNLAPREAGRW